MRKLLTAVTMAGSIAAASPAAAQATLQINGAGQLTGATGVDVGGTLYDVTFVDSSCTSVFAGCDSASDLDFTTQASASVAAQALLDQVFLGTFDSMPSMIFGCQHDLLCEAFIPYSTVPGNISVELASNWSAISGSNDSIGAANLGNFQSSDLTNFSSQVYAKFTTQPIAASVPEPATWTMMLIGFGAVGASMRRRKAELSFRRVG